MRQHAARRSIRAMAVGVVALACALRVAPALADEPVAPASAAAPAAAAPPAAAAAPTADAGVLADRVVAVVNDDVVLLSEVYAFDTYIEEQAAAGKRAAAEREVVDRILQQRLIAQEVARLHLEVTDADIDRNIDDIAQRNGLDRDQLRAEVEKEMTWAAYRQELSKGLQEMKFAQSVLRPRINITEDELKDAYIRATKDSPQVARVQAIFLAWPLGADDAARAALRQKAAGIVAEAATTDFAALSRTYDQGPFGAQGGDMGRFKPGELVGGLDAVVRDTPTGSVAAPVETPQGIFIVRVAERSAGDTDFATLRPKLEESVFESRMADEEKRWFEQAKRQAAIRILL